MKAAGKAQHSFAVNHLMDSSLTPEKEDLVRWASNSMFIGMDFSSLATTTLPLSFVPL